MYAVDRHEVTLIRVGYTAYILVYREEILAVGRCVDRIVYDIFVK